MIHSIRQFSAGFTGAAGDLRTRRAMRSYDQALLWGSLLLLGFGLVRVCSASISLPAAPKYAAYQGHHFLVRHLAALVLGFTPAWGAFQAPMTQWEKAAPKLFIGALVLLTLVFAPVIGKGVNGSHRWISLGIAHIQPSE